MPSQRTEITEITTGLATLGYQTLDRALEVRPRHIAHVDATVFDRLESARASGSFDDDFLVAWNNGVAFSRSEHGLRGRPPWSIEWKGHHRPASRTIETIPADIRIDHVFLISCKYGSRILHNSSPTMLFDHCLAPSVGSTARANWFETVAPNAFRAVWQPIFKAAGVNQATPATLSADQRSILKRYLASEPLDTRSDAYVEFVAHASAISAARWRTKLSTADARREMVWRLLRMQAAPYFVVGSLHDRQAIAYRVNTPWDFQQRFQLAQLTIDGGRRGQPSVDWFAEVVEPDTGYVWTVGGYVEVRWSHGKLLGAPEAKVHLETHPHLVPGYDALVS